MSPSGLNRPVQHPRLPDAVRRCLAGQPVSFHEYDTDTHTTLERAATRAGLDAQHMLRGVIVTNGMDYILNVLPVSHALDFTSLRKRFGDTLRLASADEMKEYLVDFDDGCIPPIGQLLGLPMVIDVSVQRLGKIGFEPGTHGVVATMDASAFILMQDAPTFFDRIALSMQDVADEDSYCVPVLSSDDVRKRIESVYELPAMPATATQILMLRNKQDVSQQELAAVIETDPSLAAQTLRYARSPLFGYRGSVETIEDAITRVLGTDMVLNMALGISVGKAFRNPADGPLGMNAFWRDSVACAELSRRLTRLMPMSKRPVPGLVYLAGLMHNFGFLLLGHLFQPEFYMLNKLAAANPKAAIADIEQRVLAMGHAREAIGLGHAQIGAWLMQSWNMPRAVVDAVLRHHDREQFGEHADTVRLVRMANLMLAHAGIGDEAEAEIPEGLFNELVIDRQAAEELFAEFIDEAIEDVNDLARLLAA